MIFTIIGAMSLLSCVICLVLFFITITQSVSITYFFMFISCLINSIAFFTLSKMKKDIEETKKLLNKHFNSNNYQFDKIETDIIKIKQKLNKKDGE